jgi:hypothetical protein
VSENRIRRAFFAQVKLAAGPPLLLLLAVMIPVNLHGCEGLG